MGFVLSMKDIPEGEKENPRLLDGPDQNALVAKGMGTSLGRDERHLISYSVFCFLP